MDSGTSTQPTRKSASGVTFNAPHLNVSIDSRHPPPIASSELLRLRRQVDITWTYFEAAELSLVALDNHEQAEVLDWISSTKGRSTNEQLWRGRQRSVMRLHEPVIADAKKRCSELESGIEALEAAVLEEHETLEATATMKLDFPVMKSGLATTLEVMDVARAQVKVAKAVLGLT